MVDANANGDEKGKPVSLRSTDLTPRIGSLVETDLASLLSGVAAAQLRSLIEQRGVIVIRGVTMDDDQQLTFTRTLGRLDDRNTGNIYKVSLDPAENPEFYHYNYGNFSWHIDRTDTDVPPFSSILNAKRLAPEGGQTEFANTYAAYEDLPDSDKRLIDRLKVVHKVEASYRESIPNPTAEQLAIWRKHPDKIHPLVWHHSSGRASLVTSTSGSRVLGMGEAEGAALLDRLMKWATRPEYVYVHEWQLDDVVMWNNTGTMHRVRPYDLKCGRLLHRTTVLGEEPIDPEVGKSIDSR
jgi:alpha-ketoglutarate-dependent taurine dioxygenase